VNKGKERIKNGVVGLILLASVYLILKTVNPELVTLKMVEVQTVQRVETPIDEGDYDPNAPAVCQTVDACRQLCNNKSAWPTSNAKTIDPTLTSKIPDSIGFKNPGGSKATKSTQLLLAKAGEIAVKTNPNYTIRIIGANSGYRPLQNQIQKVCDLISSADQNSDMVQKNKKLESIGKSVAWPGGSNHGSGIAVDVQLYEGGQNLMTLDVPLQNNPKYKSPAEILSKIMDEAGFVRYSKEIWHFEAKDKASSNCRCSFPNCPFPPKC
jgi:hypothetical protein